MDHLFSMNAEGGPLLCMDAGAGKHWNGSDAGGTDYAIVCSLLDGSPNQDGIIANVRGHPAIIWEMQGAGTADVFYDTDGLIRVVRAWVDQDTPEELHELACTNAPSHIEIGSIEIPSKLIALLWAPESGTEIPLSIQHDFQKVTDTSIEGSAFVLRGSSFRYRCQHDQVSVGKAQARRLTLVPE